MSPEEAKHTLFSFGNGTSERLELHIFFDVSVLEVFVNRRTVISTRIYAKSGRCFGVRWLRRNPSEGDVSEIELGGNNDMFRRQGFIEGMFWSLREAVRFE